MSKQLSDLIINQDSLTELEYIAVTAAYEKEGTRSLTHPQFQIFLTLNALRIFLEQRGIHPQFEIKL